MNDEKYDRRFDESRYPEFMKKIIATLRKLNVKFQSADYLVDAIQHIGFFNGIAEFKDGDWSYFPFYRVGINIDWDEYYKWDDRYCDCDFNKNSDIPDFACMRTENYWWCRIATKKHYVDLGFDIYTGELKDIQPDYKNLVNFWKSDTKEGRIQEIKDLLED